jgi:hypothetical protein
MDLAIFHQCYKERAATEFSMAEFRRHNLNYDYYLVSDGGDDFSDIALKHGVKWFYEPNITMNGIDSSKALPAIKRIKKYFEISRCKYLLLMEDDLWCRGKIDFKFDFNALGANSKNNIYDNQALEYVAYKYKVTIRNNYFNLCGGSILNGEIFIKNFDLIEQFIMEDHDHIRNLCNNFYGSLDSILNMLYIVCNKEIGINPELTETWRDRDWKTNGKKLVHWYKSHYVQGEGFQKYYLS